MRSVYLDLKRKKYSSILSTSTTHIYENNAKKGVLVDMIKPDWNNYTFIFIWTFAFYKFIHLFIYLFVLLCPFEVERDQKFKSPKVRQYSCEEVNTMCMYVCICVKHVLAECCWPNVCDGSKRKWTKKKTVKLTFATSMNIFWGWGVKLQLTSVFSWKRNGNLVDVSI